MRCVLRIALVALLLLLLPAVIKAQERAGANADQVRFFESKIRPLLAEHCYKCHGPDEQESDLRLDSYQAILTGGAAGPAVVPGEVEQSLLLTAVSYRDDDLQMPPDKKLADGQIADLRRWVEMGAPHPDADGTPAPKPTAVDLEAGRQFWAFQPPAKPPLPAVENTDWVRMPIDRFILAELQRQGIQPLEPADKRTLIRRATFDLLGLPPTPDEIAAFLADDSPAAFARVVDRLLASPRYGERWGRHWLDVARYADSNGLDENIAHGNAWRYRDYVIAAFNADKPYDQFVVEQLAGDLLPDDGDERLRHQRLIATGFLSLGPKVLAEVDEQKMEMDIVDEQVDTFGRAFVALTLGCARCHDHKFDPIRMHDYYALAGIFKSTRTMESFTKIARWNENSIATAADQAARQEHDAKIAAQQAAIKAVVDRANERLRAKLGADAELPKDAEEQYDEATQEELAELRDRLLELQAATPQLPTAMGVGEGEVADARIHVRGSHLTLGTAAERSVPAVLAGDAPPAIDAAHSGRLQLARWLVEADHPLTGRVIVNRVWRWHFGQGLVRSTDNFGRLGARPSHPQLLDWLAVSFVESGWSIKELHRQIMLSSTYQLAGRRDEQRAAADPDNRWYWRYPLRRLEAEALRDALLAAAGTIDFSMGGSMLHVENRAFLFDHTSKDETSYDTQRRSIYLPVVRNNLYDVFSLFDYTDAGVPLGNRPTSTVATQALFMMNSELVSDSATALAARLLASDDERARADRLYEIALGRPAGDVEAARVLQFVRAFADAAAAPGEEDEAQRTLRGWAAVCQVVLASNEFAHVR